MGESRRMANASGLPCIIVANETFEISNGKYLAGLGSSIFAGFHNYINIDAFTMELDIEKIEQRRDRKDSFVWNGKYI